MSKDILYTSNSTVCKFDGLIKNALIFAEHEQLLSPERWAKFVRQFKFASDDHDTGWRGEYWGKMMRGAAFVYGCTRNAELFRIMTETVEDMLTASDGLGRISSYSTENEFQNWDMWCRKYVLLGMQYYLEYCEDSALRTRVIASMRAQVDYLISKIGPEEEGKMRITKTSKYWRGLNASSVLEPIVRLYNLTGEQKYLDFAAYIVSEGCTDVGNIFELAYENIADPYQYPITKAYEMMSCFEGLLEYYKVTGIEKHRIAVINFARRVAKSDITVIGTAGCTHELFDHSAARQTWFYPGIMQETCVTVTWMKFCYRLLELTGDAEFADLFEKALYNAYLGALNVNMLINDKSTDYIRRRYVGGDKAIPEALPFDSYSALRSGTRGEKVGGLKIMSDYTYYGCCACIGAAGIGLVGNVSVMSKEKGIAVNLYNPSTVETVTPSGGRLVLTTETGYPVDGKIIIRLSLDREESFDIDLRIPEWSENTKLYVNGESAETTVGYTTVSRKFRDGDVIELCLDMTAKVIHPIPNKKDVLFTDWLGKEAYMPPVVVEEPEDALHFIAIRRGPLMLACDKRVSDPDAPIDLDYSENDTIKLKPGSRADFVHMCEFEAPQKDGTSVTFIDYMSAGQTYNEDSRYACWIPTKR